MKVIAWGLQMLNHLSQAGRQTIAELRGEKMLSSYHFNRLVVEVAEVLTKNGYPLKVNDDYNALRSALDNYFVQYHDYTIDDDDHTDWNALLIEHQNPSILAKTSNWLKSKLARSNSSI